MSEFTNEAVELSMDELEKIVRTEPEEMSVTDQTAQAEQDAQAD